MFSRDFRSGECLFEPVIVSHLVDVLRGDFEFSFGDELRRFDGDELRCLVDEDDDDFLRSILFRKFKIKDFLLKLVNGFLFSSTD